MDSNEVKKKFFDVAPPKASANAPTVQARKSQMITVKELEPAKVDESTTLLAPADNVPHRELVINVPEPSEEVSDTLVKETEIVAEPIAEASEEPSVDKADEKSETSNSGVVVNDTETKDIESAADEPAAEASVVEPLPETKVSEEPKENQPSPREIAEADKDIPAPEGFAISDSLPDTDAATAKDDMQDPKIYDTNAYHVSIKETHHGHGSAKSAFVFGAVFAVLVVAGAVYIFARLGS